MIGIAASTKAESLGLVTTIMTLAPTNKTRLRSATEIDEPTLALICVVSAVSRDTISPVLAASKKAADSDVRCAKTSLRRSATMLSPSVVTR